MTRVLRILLVEDHTVVAEGLRALLEEDDDLSVVGIARTAGEAVEMAVAMRPDVVLMDHHLPDASGAVAGAAMRDRGVGAAVVFLSGSESDEALVAALDSGARGYLLKSDPPQRVVDAIRRAAAGEMLVSADVLARVLRRRREAELRDAERLRHRDALTARELEVLRLMRRGLDSRAIAAELSVRFTTVRAHVRSILAKLDAHSRLEAVARADEAGLFDD